VAGIVVVIAAAAAVWQNLPTQTDILGPFDVHGEVGAATTGRGVTATVTGVRVTPKVNSVQPSGIWVVVDTTLEGTRTTEVPHSELIVGPNTYRPTDLFLVETLGAVVNPGIAQRGAWVFDVAPALMSPARSEPLTLRVWVGDGRLDSRLVIRIPAGDFRISRPESVTVERPRESAENGESAS